MRPAAYVALLSMHFRPGRLRHARMCATSAYHVPVLCSEAVEWLISDPAGTYVDGTLGGGGHSAALLAALAPHDGHLISLDRDPDALTAAGKRLEPYVASRHATLVRSNFGAMPDALRAVRTGDGSDGLLHGILLDLGVSSYQLDEGTRGFSYTHDGPLDMRMDQSSSAGGETTADTIVNTWEGSAIADVLWRYGEERESRRIARAILAARPLHTTADLVAVLRKAGSKREPKEVTKRLARVFQALRIEVNQEMAELENVLTAAARLVRPGGRIAVMSYHSLEDRRVKRLLRSGGFSDTSPPTDFYGNVLAPWRPLTRQPIVASDAEIAANSRARSVRLRVGERTEHPPT
jgi:16S rRNA (cytosine1402-N4)-methyltransferase